MIAAKYTQGGRFEIGASPVPRIQDNELLLRVDAAAICATDMKIIRHGHRKLRRGQTIILGHEFAGTITEAGRQVKRFRPGMRVGVAPNMGCGACPMCARGLGNMCPDYTAFGITRDGAHAEYVRIPAAAIQQGNVLPLPEGTAATDAALAEPLSCVVNGVRAARLEAGDTVVVFGAGPMGLLNIMLAAKSGAVRVVAVDPQEERLRVARAVGATDAVNPDQYPIRDWIMDATNGHGADVVITAVALPHLQQDALAMLAPFGRLCLFAGWPNGAADVALDTNPIHYKNLLVTGMTGGSVRDYSIALELIANRRIDPGPIVSDVVPMQELEQAYALALSGQRLKIVLGAGKIARHTGLGAGAPHIRVPTETGTVGSSEQMREARRP